MITSLGRLRAPPRNQQIISLDRVPLPPGIPKDSPRHPLIFMTHEAFWLLPPPSPPGDQSSPKDTEEPRKAPQGRPETPGTPKGPPRGSKGALRTHKGGEPNGVSPWHVRVTTRDPEGLPRNTQKAPKGPPKGPTKASQGPPREPDGPPEASPRTSYFRFEKQQGPNKTPHDSFQETKNVSCT